MECLKNNYNFVYVMSVYYKIKSSTIILFFNAKKYVKFKFNFIKIFKYLLMIYFTKKKKKKTKHSQKDI